MILKKIFSLILFSLLFLSIYFASCAPLTVTGLTEYEAINYLADNPDYIAIDLRWQDAYEGGHIPGAYLINIQLPWDQVLYYSLELANREADDDTAFFIYCNCGAGSSAKSVGLHLESNGYSNIRYFADSFSNWADDTVLVTGPNRFYSDTTITFRPPDETVTTGGNQNDLSPILMGTAGIIGLLALGGGIFFFTSSTRNQNVDVSSTKEDIKKKEELDKLQQIIKERKELDIKKTRKVKRR